jgi:MoaA/NifB/PqqE/SkfB family radical SAM enzyme
MIERGTRAADRRAFRAHPLDGAMLFFQPATGTHVRVASEATRALRRIAPRVVMFGITNRCNLACAFCSRDVARASEWTVGSAYAVLRGLADAGTLEAAFGGGEPFVFRGFEELLVRLHETTPLALHVTTNGTRLHAVDWARLGGALGQVRVSIYDEVDWRASGALLSRVGQRWGANVLVDDGALEDLPRRLEQLARLGARDVSLLSYVGPDALRHLGAEGESRLARIIERSPLPARLSVCFGDRVDAPRLFRGSDDTGDCGAGRDFVSITPDRRLQSCSFQDASSPIETAADVLRLWNEEREALARRAPRDGCARAAATAPSSPRSGPRSDARGGASVRVWRAFSGNNSGECVMVARFATVDDAEAYLADLLPGFTPGDAYSPAWRELFGEAGVATPSIEYARPPDELLGAGRSVFARTRSAAEDDFPELRALAWKRGGEVLAGGVHEHDTPMVLFAMRARTVDPAVLLAWAEELDPNALAVRHGDLVLGAAPVRTWIGDALALLRDAAEGQPFAAEIYFGALDAQTLTDEAKRLGAEIGETSRVAFSFWAATPEQRASRAADFERTIADAETPTARAANTVVAERARGKRRLAVLGHRAGAFVEPLLATKVRVRAQMWREPPPRTKGKKPPAPPVLEVDVVRGAIEPRLRAALGAAGFELSCEAGPSWRQGVILRVTTGAPLVVVQTIAALAAEMPDVSVATGVTDTSVLALALRRLVAEVREDSRRAE